MMSPNFPEFPMVFELHCPVDGELLLRDDEEELAADEEEPDDSSTSPISLGLNTIGDTPIRLDKLVRASER